jgi:hypothetical protein
MAILYRLDCYNRFTMYCSCWIQVNLDYFLDFDLLDSRLEEVESRSGFASPEYWKRLQLFVVASVKRGWSPDLRSGAKTFRSASENGNKKRKYTRILLSVQYGWRDPLSDSLSVRNLSVNTLLSVHYTDNEAQTQATHSLDRWRGPVCTDKKAQGMYWKWDTPPCTDNGAPCYQYVPITRP